MNSTCETSGYDFEDFKNEMKTLREQNAKMSDNEFSLHLQEKFDALKKSSGSTGSVGAVSL